MAKKDFLLQILNFDAGIAPSPFKGFEKIVGADLVSAPGIARVGFLGVKKSGTTITGRPTWIDADPLTGTTWLVDTDHKVYSSTDSGVTWALVTHTGASAGAGNGLRVWKNYLFLSGTQAIDVYGPLNGTPAWTNAWQTFLTSGGLHPMIWANDDKLYHGSAQTVTSVGETIGSTFAPATAASYIYAQSALTLPANVYIRCMEELGSVIYLGTWNAAQAGAAPIALIYPWDKHSATYNVPLRLSGNGVHALKTIEQNLYILHGVTGKVSYTNGYQIFSLGGLNYPGNESYTPQPGAIMSHNSRLYFGFGSGTTYPNGVYSITPAGILSAVGMIGGSAPIFTCENGTTQGVSTTQTIGALFSAPTTASPYQYMIGWQDTGAVTQGVDLVGTSGYKLTGTGCTIDSAFYNIGLPNRKVKIFSLSVQLEMPLATGQSMVFAYRTDRNAGYTVFGESSYTPTNTNSKSSFEIPFNGLETDSIQIRTQMGSATSSTASPGLIQITLQTQE